MKHKNILTKAFAMLIALLFTLTGARADELTLYNGTAENTYVPFQVGSFGNQSQYHKSQFIIPAGDLAAMKGATVTALKFYTKAAFSRATPNVTVFVKEVNYTTFSSNTVNFETVGTTGTVYTGTLNTSNNQVAITFSTPFTYTGGNLLISIGNTASSTNTNSGTFWGEDNHENAACYGAGRRSQPTAATARQSFLPKTTFTYTFAAPTNVTVSNVGPYTATVSWPAVSGATGYELEYGAGDYSGKKTLKYDDGVRVISLGSSTAREQTWGVRYPAEQITANQLSKVIIYETGYNTGDITIKIYSGGTTPSNGTLLYTETVATEHKDDFHEVKFATPVTLNTEEDLWITLTETGTYVKALCNSSEDNNQWTLNSYGQWTSIDASDSDNASRGFMIRAEIHGDVDPSITWATMDATSPYSITNLAALTNYIVRVKAKFGSNASEWTVTDFTTTTDNPVPTNVSVTPSYTSAEISWTGYSDSYQVEYRKKGFFEDFEDGIPSTWRIVTNGDSPNSDGWVVFNGQAASYSWQSGTAYAADNWLITPSIELGGTLSFYAYSGYGDMFEVLLSTTTNTDVASFTTELRSMRAAPHPGAYVTIDLSAYAGQTGYIAIHHVFENGYYLDIDDFEVNGNEWRSVTTNTTSVELTSLAPGTTYDFTIIGIKNGTPNEGTPAHESFTTLETNEIILANATSNEDVIFDLDGSGKTYNVKLADRTFKKNGNWNSICLPFDVTLAGSPLEGAEVGTLSSTTTLVNDKLTVRVDPVTTTTLTAGTPYLLRWESGDNIVEPVFEDVTITKEMHDVTCDLGEGKSITFKGNYNALKFTAVDKSVLFINNNKVYYVGVNSTINSQRAYFKIVGDEGGSVKQMVLDLGEDGATGIETIDIATEGGLIYNVAGQRLNKMQKGINIVNGKKILK